MLSPSMASPASQPLWSVPPPTAITPSSPPFAARSSTPARPIGDVVSLQADCGLPYKEAKEQLVDAFEAAYFRRLLALSHGNVSSVARAAGIDRKHLYTLMKKHGLEAKDGARRGGEE